MGREDFYRLWTGLSWLYEMRRRGWFVILTAGSLSAFLSILLFYAVAYGTGILSVQTMTQQMMGGFYSGSPSSQMMPVYAWASFVTLIALAIVGIAGFTYYMVFPEIRSSQPVTETDSQPAPTFGTENPRERWSTVLVTSKPDERKVLEVLAAHDGKHMQKLVVKESGLSKLRVHRIISRLAERGIVKVTKSGNTNEVSLAEWLDKGASSEGKR